MFRVEIGDALCTPRADIWIHCRTDGRQERLTRRNLMMDIAAILFLKGGCRYNRRRDYDRWNE